MLPECPLEGLGAACVGSGVSDQLLWIARYQDGYCLAQSGRWNSSLAPRKFFDAHQHSPAIRSPQIPMTCGMRAMLDVLGANGSTACSAGAPEATVRMLQSDCRIES